jgi:hypothetical protein
MKQNRAPFQPLDPDLDDKLENLARDKGVGALVKPTQGERGPRLQEPPRQSEKPKAAATPAPLTPMKTLNVELPDYVWTDLKIRAAQQKTSLRHVIMTALRKDGFAIKESDMIDANLLTRGHTK